MLRTKIPGGWIFYESDDDRRQLIDNAKPGDIQTEKETQL